MQILTLVATAFITFFGVYGVCLLLGHIGDESNKRKAYIRDLDHQNELIKAGINPQTMQAFGLDHSHDYCNANNPCDGCKAVQEKNDQLNKSAWDAYNSRSIQPKG